MTNSFKELLKAAIGTVSHEEMLVLAKDKGIDIKNIDLSDKDSIEDLIVDTLKPGMRVEFTNSIKDVDGKVIFKAGQKIEVDDLV